MVVVVDHFRFVEGQVAGFAGIGDDEVVSFEAVALRFQLFAGTEQVGVARHIKEALFEGNAPGVFFGLAVAGFLDEYGDAAIDGLGEFGVRLGPEDGAGAGIGIEQGDVFGGQGKVAVGFAQVVGVEGEEDEIGRGEWRVASSE